MDDVLHGVKLVLVEAKRLRDKLVPLDELRRGKAHGNTRRMLRLMDSRTDSGAGTDGLPIEKSKTFPAPISALRALPYAAISRMDDFDAPYS